MFAVSFDFSVSDLKKYYGDPYHKAYFDMRNIMLKYGFTWIQGSTYVLTTRQKLINIDFKIVNSRN